MENTFFENVAEFKYCEQQWQGKVAFAEKLRAD
jgi:hypothetical protein